MDIEIIPEEDVLKLSRKIRRGGQYKILTITKDDPETFWNNVDVGEKDECWNWKGYMYPYVNGYGMAIFNKKTTGGSKIPPVSLF